MSHISGISNVVTPEAVKTVLNRLGLTEIPAHLMSLLPLLAWADPDSVDWERVKTLDEEWVRQLWAQVMYESTHKTEEGIKNGNGGFSKLKAVISDLFDFDAPQDMWRWRKVSEVAEQLNDFVHPQMSAAQINKILRSLTEDDSRLQIRNRAGVRMYLLPPLAV